MVVITSVICTVCVYALYRSRCFRKSLEQEGKTRALPEGQEIADMRDCKSLEVKAAIQSIGKSKRSLFTLTILSGNLDAVNWAASVIQRNFDDAMEVSLATENSLQQCFSLSMRPVFPVANGCLTSRCVLGSDRIKHLKSTPWGVFKGALNLAVNVRCSSLTLCR